MVLKLLRMLTATIIAAPQDVTGGTRADTDRGDASPQGPTPGHLSKAHACTCLRRRERLSRTTGTGYIKGCESCPTSWEQTESFLKDRGCRDDMSTRETRSRLRMLTTRLAREAPKIGGACPTAHSTPAP